jgi:ABC-type lipoprotein export system ATPase subunit
MPQAKPLIDMNELVKIYKSGDEDLRALDGVSLHVNDGEFVAIRGASG